MLVDTGLYSVASVEGSCRESTSPVTLITTPASPAVYELLS